MTDLLRLEMAFAQKLLELRKKRKVSQMQLAEAIGLHFSQIKRYEAGTSQPTLEVLRNLAEFFSCTTDELIFGSDERTLSEDLQLQFTAISSMNDDDRLFVKEVLDALILRCQARQWTKAS